MRPISQNATSRGYEGEAQHEARERRDSAPRSIKRPRGKRKSWGPRVPARQAPSAAATPLPDRVTRNDRTNGQGFPAATLWGPDRS